MALLTAAVVTALRVVQRVVAPQVGRLNRGAGLGTGEPGGPLEGKVKKKRRGGERSRRRCAAAPHFSFCRPMNNEECILWMHVCSTIRFNSGQQRSASGHVQWIAHITEQFSGLENTRYAALLSPAAV